MKKRINANFLMVIIAVVIMPGIFGAMANQSRAQAKQITESANGINDNQSINAPRAGIPVGEYAFMSVSSQRSDGSANVNTNVHGSLILKDDGTYEHSIYIGNSPGGCGPGTYSISDDTLRLIPNDSTGCNAKDWKYIYSTQMNRLSLHDDNVTLLYCVAGGKDCFSPGE